MLLATIGKILNEKLDSHVLQEGANSDRSEIDFKTKFQTCDTRNVSKNSSFEISKLDQRKKLYRGIVTSNSL
jgi:hypothetical protein